MSCTGTSQRLMSDYRYGSGWVAVGPGSGFGWTHKVFRPSPRELYQFESTFTAAVVGQLVAIHESQRMDIHFTAADATRRRGCDDAPQYDAIISAGTEKAFSLRQVYQDMELRLLQLDHDRGRQQQASVATSLNGLPRPPDRLAEGGLEPKPQQQVGPARMANAMRGRRQQRSASLSGSGSRGRGGVGSGAGGRGIIFSSVDGKDNLGRGLVRAAGLDQQQGCSNQQHEAVEAGWRRLWSTSMSGSSRSVLGGSRRGLSCAGLDRVDLSTDAASAPTTKSPAARPSEEQMTAIGGQGGATPQGRRGSAIRAGDAQDEPIMETAFQTRTGAGGTISAAMEEEEEEEEEERHWVPPSSPASFLASISTRSLLDCFSLAADEGSGVEADIVEEGRRRDDTRYRRSSSCGGGGSGEKPLLDPQEANRYLRSSSNNRLKPLLELRAAFSSVTRGRVSASSGGGPAVRHRLSQSGNGRQCSDDDDFFMMPRSAYHDRSRTQSLSGASAIKDTLTAHAAAIGGTLHEQMKQYIRCTQSLSGVAIAEEDAASSDCDLLPAFAHPPPPCHTGHRCDMKQRPRTNSLSGGAGTPAAACMSGGQVAAPAGTTAAERTAMDTLPAAPMATPPRDMLSARRRQRSYSCSGGGIVHTSEVHTAPPPGTATPLLRHF